MKNKSAQYNFSKFTSLSNEQMSFAGMLEAIFAFVQEDSDSEYRVIVGTDSEGYGDVRYVSAVVVHRVGHGGRGFVCRNTVFTAPKALRQKIYNEALISIALTQELVPSLTETLGEEFIQDNLIIHIDVGQNGDTKDIIREVAGMATGYGFQVRTKPDSFAASNVADKFCAPPKHVSPLPAA